MDVAIRVYTDGACEPNPGPGAWGAYWKGSDGKDVEICGFEAGTTNQRMEMMAAIAALETIEERGLILVLTDSKYVINGITRWIVGWKRNGWKTKKREPVKNKDLWKRLDAAVSDRVMFDWVKGHSGDPGNDRADALARGCLLDTLRGDPGRYRAAVRGFSRHGDFDPTRYRCPVSGAMPETVELNRGPRGGVLIQKDGYPGNTQYRRADTVVDRAALEDTVGMLELVLEEDSQMPRTLFDAVLVSTVKAREALNDS